LTHAVADDLTLLVVYQTVVFFYPERSPLRGIVVGNYTHRHVSILFFIVNCMQVLYYGSSPSTWCVQSSPVNCSYYEVCTWVLDNVL